MTNEEAMKAIRDAVRLFHAKTGSVEETLTLTRNKTTKLHPVIVDHAINCAIREVIYESRDKGRQNMRRSSINLDDRTRAGAAMLAAILDTWRIGPKSLGDCTGVELDASAEWERELAAGHSRNAAFYAGLRQLVGDDETVRTVVNNAKAAEILSKVCG